MMLLIYLATSALCSFILCYPFFFSKTKPWQYSAPLANRESFEIRKKSLIRSYVKYETAFKGGKINKQEWTSRKSFLESSYINLTKQDPKDTYIKEGEVLN